MIKLVATDLDGTLLDSQGKVSDRTREALLAVEAAGVEVVFVTGRPLRWAREVFEYVGGHGLAIISNGALVWDVARDEMQRLRPIGPAEGLAAARLIRDAIPDTHFAVETLEGIALEEWFMERYPVPDGARRGSLEEIFDRPAVKLLARHESLDPQEFWDLARDAVGERLVTTWSSATTLLECSAPGVTKASTLALLCAERGISADEVIAFGDMPNDIPLLGWAGSSYAMSNAHPTVIEAADHVASSNDDHGVAVVLEALLRDRARPGSRFGGPDGRSVRQ